MMTVKQVLKRNAYIYQFNMSIKARLQEMRAASEYSFYFNKAQKDGLKIKNISSLKRALNERLKKRGIQTKIKQKGDLHIFLAYPLNNWEGILPIALRPYGKVTEFEWSSLGFNHNSTDWFKQRESMNKEMLETFYTANAKMPVDIVVSYVSGYTVNCTTLKKMGKAGAVLVNFNWDDKLRFGGKMLGGRRTGPAAIAKVVDLNLTNAPESCVKYFVEGGLGLFWPEAAHPEFHKPYDLSFEYDVSFVGSKYGWRPKFIEKLRRMGIHVTCFGHGWENGPLSDKEMVKTYSRSYINLGFSGVGHSKKLMCIKGRDFEIPMSGNLYLTQNNPELRLVYKIGNEIITYIDVKDCAQKIKWLLDNPNEARKVRKEGRTRALKDHTWKNRFDKIFNIIGIME